MSIYEHYEASSLNEWFLTADKGWCSNFGVRCEVNSFTVKK